MHIGFPPSHRVLVTSANGFPKQDFAVLHVVGVREVMIKGYSDARLFLLSHIRTRERQKLDSFSVNCDTNQLGTDPNLFVSQEHQRSSDRLHGIFGVILFSRGNLNTAWRASRWCFKCVRLDTSDGRGHKSPYS